MKLLKIKSFIKIRKRENVYKCDCLEGEDVCYAEVSARINVEPQRTPTTMYETRMASIEFLSLCVVYMRYIVTVQNTKFNGRTILDERMKCERSISRRCESDSLYVQPVKNKMTPLIETKTYVYIASCCDPW